MDLLSVLITSRRVHERAASLRAVGGIPNRDARDRASRYEREIHLEFAELCAALGYEVPDRARHDAEVA